MNLKNCPKCRKLFIPKNSNICPECVRKDDETFVMLREYIDDNPQKTIAEVSAATAVPPKQILKYVTDGRLEIHEGMHGEVTCESCDEPINKGRFCISCLTKMNQDIHDVLTEKRDVVAKMHIKKRL